MLTAKQLQAIQRVGQKTLTTSVTIFKRQPYAHDDSNPFGDDTVSYATTGKKVKGWLVPTNTVDFSMGVAQIISEGNFVLRVPVGTDVEPGDKAVIGGNDYAVSESTTEQTWPEWTSVRLRRIQ